MLETYMQTHAASGVYLNGTGQSASEGAVRGDRDAIVSALVHPPAHQLLPVLAGEGSVVGNAGSTQQYIPH